MVKLNHRIRWARHNAGKHSCFFFTKQTRDLIRSTVLLHFTETTATQGNLQQKKLRTYRHRSVSKHEDDSQNTCYPLQSFGYISFINYFDRPLCPMMEIIFKLLH